MSGKQDVEIATGVDDAKAITQAAIDRRLTGRSGITVLEAGGGSLSRVQLPADCEITVIDISPEQLASNTSATHRILGDLHTYQLTPDSFDLVICWDVLEHLDDPSSVYANLMTATKPDGLVVVAAPNPRSLSGMITNYTPHWFHVLVLRHVFKNKTAGLPGHAPFPTFMRKGMYPDELRKKALAMKVGKTKLVFYESSRRAALRRNNRLLGALFDMVIYTARLFSFGTLRLEHSDYIFLATPQDARR